MFESDFNFVNHDVPMVQDLAQNNYADGVHFFQKKDKLNYGTTLA